MSWVRRRGAPRRATARPAVVFFGREEGNRGGGKVGNLLLVFHFSIRRCRRSCGNVEIPPLLRDSQGARGKRGKPAVGFPRFPQPRHFHSSPWILVGPVAPAGVRNPPPPSRRVLSPGRRTPRWRFGRVSVPLAAGKSATWLPDSVAVVEQFSRSEGSAFTTPRSCRESLP